MGRRNLLLLAAAAAIAGLPLFLTVGEQAAFGGADNQATALVQKLRPGYEPWTTPVWEPPSSEIASLLFALQAALGAGFLGYYFGVRHAQAKAKAGARRSDNARD